MAFNSIPSESIKVGSATKKELFDKIKNSLDDLDLRINGLETTSSKVPVMKFYVLNGSSFNSATGLYYYESNQAFTITDAYVQIFEKGSLAGTFEIDIQKSITDLNGTSFSSIFTTKPSIDFTTATDYSKSTNQVFDPLKVSMLPNQYLRLDITQAPTSGVMSKFLVTVYGE